MRTILLSLSIVLLSVATSSCTKQAKSNDQGIDTALLRIEQPTMAYLKAHGFVRYNIAEGAHVATPRQVQLLDVEKIAFYFYFDSTAVYKSKTEENQYDINKLWGFSDGLNHHDNSARLGWNWVGDRLWVHPYTYVAGERKEQPYVLPVDIGRPHYCSITVLDSTYLYNVDGAEFTVPRGPRGAAKGYQLYPYFGGSEVSPHDITIWIKTLYL